ELELEPAAVVGAHVHGQRLGDGAEAARLVGSVDPDFKREAALAVVFHVADEEAEFALRGGQHVGPGGVAVGQLGAAGPAQGRQYRGGQALDGQATVGVGDFDVV